MTDRPDEQIENGLTRRQFISAAAATGVGAVVFTGCQDVPRREFQAQSRLQIAEDVLAGLIGESQSVRSAQSATGSSDDDTSPDSESQSTMLL